MTVELPRKIAHAIRLERDGYSTALKLFTLVSNEKSQNFIRFGLSEDLGYYLDLEPSAMKAKMRNKLVPYSVGADSFEKMALCVLQADERLEMARSRRWSTSISSSRSSIFFESQS